MTGPRSAPRPGYQPPQLPRPGLLRLNSNEGPCPSPDLAAAVVSEVMRRYPDTSVLERALAERFGVEPTQVVVTAGGDEAIDRCCRAFVGPDRALLQAVPTFEMFEHFAVLARGRVVGVPWRDAFPLEAVLRALDDRIGLVALVSPNNPTGAALDRKQVEAVARAAAPAVVLLDHAYAEYADEDLTEFALRFPNVAVLRTFSKAWGLAGCRVGYLLAPPAVASRVREAGGPYAVAAPSVAIALARLRQGDAGMSAHVECVKAQRRRLTSRLRDLGVAVPESQTNFVLAGFGPAGAFVRDGLLALGILVRDFTHRDGLEGSLRITLPGDTHDFDRLERALDLLCDPEAILFDLDGVVADVRDSYRACVVETARSYGVTLTRADVATAKREGDANNDWVVTHRLMEKRGVHVDFDEVVRQFQAHYLGQGDGDGLHRSEQLLVDPRFLERLARQRPLAVVTGRPRAEAEAFLARTGVTHHFSALVCMEDAPAKPDPTPVRIALERLGVSRAWMVGDTPDDARAAAAAGALPVSVVAPGEDVIKARAALEAAGAVRVFEQIGQLEEVLP